jgi:general secretion pathway protein D
MMGGMGLGGMGYGGMGGGGMGYGGMGGGGMGYGGMGGGGMGYGGMGGGGMGYGGMGGGGMGYGGMGYGGMNYGGMPYANAAAQQGVTATGGVTTAPTTAGTTTTGTTAAGDLTGSYLGSPLGFAMNYHPRIIPNPFDNTLLIQGTPQEWEEIKQLIEQIDIPPRQVLIEAKVYEVELTGVFSQGVQSFLQARSANGTATNTSSTGTSSTASRFFQGTNSVANGLTLTAGLLVGHSRELLGILTANETTTKVKVISAPSVIATDSIPASINVGQDVPTLASQAVSGAQVGGTSLFANTISNRSTGVGLNIMARVNSSGIVTMVINQQVSSPQAPAANASIQSPSFQQRTVQTQVTVQDGDTVSIGGIIEETDTSSSGGVPYLHRIPILGGAFGGKNSNKARTELVVFLTPRVIYDTNEMVEASDELKGKLKRLQRMIKE